MKQNDWPKVEEILEEIERSKVSESHGNGNSSIVKIHTMAEKELQVIRNQLEMRTSIVDLSKALKIGWARCSNGIVDTDTLQVDSLIDAISRAERSMQDLGISNEMKKNSHFRSTSSSPFSMHTAHSPSATGKTDISVSLSMKDEQQLRSTPPAAASPSIKRYRKHFPMNGSTDSSVNLRKKVLTAGNGNSNGGGAGGGGTERKDDSQESVIATAAAAVANAPKSKLQEQVEKLLLSAGVVTEVRKALLDGNIQLAGELSEEALQIPELHASVQEELTHYATEIGRALHMMRLCSELRAGIAAGNGEHIEKILQEAQEATIELSSDLGLIRTMEKAQSVLKSINKLKKELNTVSNVYSIQRYESLPLSLSPSLLSFSLPFLCD
jgi:hypothetical protein